MDKLKFFVNAVDTMNRRIALGLMWLTLVIAALLTLTAIARYVFHRPFTWSLDATMFISGGFLLLTGAYCLLVKSHVNMDILRSRLSLRAGAALDVFTSIFIFAPQKCYFNIVAVPPDTFLQQWMHFVRQNRRSWT